MGDFKLNTCLHTCIESVQSFRSKLLGGLNILILATMLFNGSVELRGGIVSADHDSDNHEILLECPEQTIVPDFGLRISLASNELIPINFELHFNRLSSTTDEIGQYLILDLEEQELHDLNSSIPSSTEFKLYYDKELMHSGSIDPNKDQSMILDVSSENPQLDCPSVRDLNDRFQNPGTNPDSLARNFAGGTVQFLMTINFICANE